MSILPQRRTGSVSSNDGGILRKGARIPGPVAPNGPVIGDLWYDTSLNVLKAWDGTNWQLVASGGGGGVTDHGALTGLGDNDHPHYATDTDLTAHAATSHGAAHPDLATHDTLGLATQTELNAHAATSHGAAHPDLSSHDALGLATQAELDAHAATSHGAAHPDLATHDTLGLATQAELDTHAGAADPHAGYLKETDISGMATPAIVLGTAAAAGSGTTTIRHNSTIIAFDATVPGTIAFGASAATGSVAFAARRDHTHGMPADPVTAHVAAGDPHTGYVLESLIDAAADLIVGTADNTVGRLAKGSALQVLRVNSGATALEWATSSATHTHDGTGGATSLIIGGTAEAGASIPVASSVGSIAIGDYANAGTSTQPIAIGTGVSTTSAPSATGQGAIAIGSSNATGVLGARATGANSLAIGSGTASTAGASTGQTGGVAVGALSFAGTTGTGSIAVGYGAMTGSAVTGSIAIGYNCVVDGAQSIGIGQNTTAPQANAVVIGDSASVSTGANGVAIGTSASATATAPIAIGSAAWAASNYSVSIGAASRAQTGTQAIAIGGAVNNTAGPQATGQGAIAIGSSNGAAITGSRSTGVSSIAIGSGDATVAGASATAAQAVAIGRTSSATHANAVALGDGVATTNTAQVNVGAKRLFSGAPTTAPADADLVNSQISFWINETDNTLVVKVKKSSGAVLSGVVALS